jgi:uncharacterized repeat protein (TIGR01451 family)
MTYDLPTKPGRLSRLRRPAAAIGALAIFLHNAAPAFADIENDANATGTYGGNPVPSNTSSAAVPVTAAGPAVNLEKSAAAPSETAGSQNDLVDAGDTIVFTYELSNTGNVTLSNFVITDPGPQFNGVNGTGTWGSYSTDPATVTIVPGGAVVTVTRTYTLSADDVYNGTLVANAVTNTADVTATPASGTPPTDSDTMPPVNIPPEGKLLVSKAAVFDTGDGPSADLNDTIIYTYTVTNVGNVSATNVSINDVHGDVAHGGPTTIAIGGAGITNETLQPGAPIAGSTDATANTGIYDLLTPGAVVTFTYTHTVTQAEVDGG